MRGGRLGSVWVGERLRALRIGDPARALDPAHTPSALGAAASAVTKLHATGCVTLGLEKIRWLGGRESSGRAASFEPAALILFVPWSEPTLLARRRSRGPSRS